MALSLSSFSTMIPSSNQMNPSLLCLNSSSVSVKFERKKRVIAVKSELKESSSSSDVTANPKKKKQLEIGSPIIIIEAPKMLKTADSIPCLRSNSNIVKAGDAGRIVSRKPKDVWAVRLSNGTYLIDEKYFKPLDLQD
ncbi:protein CHLORORESPIRATORY REDUCTION 42, chloroplastic [Impatiens glandulifera]|uniref:protein CHLORORESPIRATORY REDUCTION 42, chloroplastic n=1 Tax=Impatiens glandulifera TaxID=253017 RepID=UPI001FB18F96|nr:protein CHLORORESPIRATORY REDUCTION 42, chloroplastic [Impatiens glandulifera]